MARCTKVRPAIDTLETIAYNTQTKDNKLHAESKGNAQQDDGGKPRQGRIALARGANIPHIGWSSHIYPLDAADFLQVPDYADGPIPEGELPPDKVILLIRKGLPDCLVRGREEIVRHLGGTVNVRVVFVPSVARWNLPGTLVRICRNRYRYHGSRVYHISAKAVRAMNLERSIRTIENPHSRAGEDRAASMIELLESLKRDGYRDDKPIVVMLCRTSGLADSLRQGHHRVSACLACGIDRMAVEFAAAGVAPWQRWGVFRRAAAVAAACAGIAAAAWALWPVAQREPTMDVRGLPQISPIGEFIRPRVPEELSGITHVADDCYYAVSDDGSGIWPMRIGIDRTTGVITNCVMGKNVRVGGDNEGIAWDRRSGTVFVTDEKSHAISEINPETGQSVAEVQLPEHQRKRRNNRGLESLAMSPDGEFLWTANEEALSGDGDVSSVESGTVVRLTKFRRQSGATWALAGEWAYLTDAIGRGKTRRMRSGVSGLCVLDDGTLLVLERELSRKGVDPSYRARLYAVRPSRDAAFDGDHPIAKKLLFGADTGTANYEGVCTGPTLDNGDRTLVMVSDGGEADDERLYVLRMTSSQEARQ